MSDLFIPLLPTAFDDAVGGSKILGKLFFIQLAIGSLHYCIEYRAIFRLLVIINGFKNKGVRFIYSKIYNEWVDDVNNIKNVINNRSVII